MLEARINLRKTGVGRALTLRIPFMFNLRYLMKPTQKNKISCEIFTGVKASRDKFLSLFSTLYRI